MTKILLLLLITAIFNSSANADLAKKVDSIISRPSQQKVKFSIHIIKADTGKTVYSRNAAIAMIPASNMKIITTSAALKYLGPDYEYKTEVGFYDGTLIITGSGDPLLGDKRTDDKYGRKIGWLFEDIIKKLKAKNITSIKDIIVDTSIFDDQRVHPNWPKAQLNKGYACEVSGLNYNDNCIAMTVKNLNGSAIVIIEPKTDFIKIINKVTPIQKGKSAVGAYRNGEVNKITVKGKCRKQQGPFDVAIERPAAFFGYMLAENLHRQAIDVQGQLFEKAVQQDRKIKLIAEYTTSMKDCLARCNKNSLNMAAESLLKTIAAESQPNRKNGSWPAGRKLVHSYLRNLGIKDNEFYVDDGCGLSRFNKLSANAITSVLYDTYKTENWQLFKDSLAVGGVDGTIRKYFKNAKYKGRIFGKTGYIAGAKSFSGVCVTANGDYIFSILANSANGKTRPAINDIAKAIFE